MRSKSPSGNWREGGQLPSQHRLLALIGKVLSDVGCENGCRWMELRIANGYP
jgi:hypothetical protein